MGNLLVLKGSWFCLWPVGLKSTLSLGFQLLRKCKVYLMWFLFSSLWRWWHEHLRNSFTPRMNFNAAAKMGPSSAGPSRPKERFFVLRVTPSHFQERLPGVLGQGCISPAAFVSWLGSEGTLCSDDYKRFPFLISFKSFSGEQKNHYGENKIQHTDTEQ